MIMIKKILIMILLVLMLTACVKSGSNFVDSNYSTKQIYEVDGKNGNTKNLSLISEAYMQCNDYCWLNEINFSPCSAIEEKVMRIEGKNSNIRKIANFYFEKCNLIGEDEDIIMIVDVETQKNSFTLFMVFLSDSMVYDVVTYDRNSLSYQFADVNGDLCQEMLIDYTVVSNGSWRYINILQFSKEQEVIVLLDKSFNSYNNILSYYFSKEIPKKFILKDVIKMEGKKVDTVKEIYQYQNEKYVLCGD